MLFEQPFGIKKCNSDIGSILEGLTCYVTGLEYLEPAKIIDTNSLQTSYGRNKRETHTCPLGWQYNITNGSCTGKFYLLFYQ